jgi:hypothetical protein
VLGPHDVEDGGGATLLPAAEAVVEPEDVGKALGVAEDLARRVLDDRGNLWPHSQHFIFFATYKWAQ